MIPTAEQMADILLTAFEQNAKFAPLVAQELIVKNDFVVTIQGLNNILDSAEILKDILKDYNSYIWEFGVDIGYWPMPQETLEGEVLIETPALISARSYAEFVTYLNEEITKATIDTTIEDSKKMLCIACC